MRSLTIFSQHGLFALHGLRSQYTLHWCQVLFFITFFIIHYLQDHMKQYMMHVQHVCLSCQPQLLCSTLGLFTIDSASMFFTCAEARRPAYTRPNSDTARSDNWYSWEQDLLCLRTHHFFPTPELWLWRCDHCQYSLLVPMERILTHHNTNRTQCRGEHTQ